MTESFSVCVESMVEASKVYHFAIGNNPQFLSENDISGFKSVLMTKKKVMEEIQHHLTSKYDGKDSEGEIRKDVEFMRANEDDDDQKRTLHAETLDVILKGEDNV